MKTKIPFDIDLSSKTSFLNQSSYCIGTGRMGLALQKAYQEQLEYVQNEIGFSYIRGHGLFCDDMAIYHERTYQDKTLIEYNFTYLDMVMDRYQELHIRPFLELGFMPEKMASGTQTVFYWKGNVTPPADETKWINLVKATLEHLIDRYGRNEVITWPVEVWNEPNLTSFWENADRKKYMRLYEITSKAVKEVDSRFMIGGPAICGVDDESWLKDFLDFCKESKAPIDMITRHAYATEQPKREGHYLYQELRNPMNVIEELHVSRKIIDSYDEFRGLPMHITEFNTSYVPNCPLHDTNLNAAYIARLLSYFGDTSASYSYWTFGDIFEESGVPFTPFHGGFGLVANGVIPKPTFYTFQFFKSLGEQALLRNEHTIVTKKEDGSIQILAYHIADKKNGDDTVELTYHLPLPKGHYTLITKTVDEETCNPLKVWYDIGAPANPTKEQTQFLRSCSTPEIRTKQLHSEHGLDVTLSVNRNAVIFAELIPVSPQTDLGYHPEWVEGILSQNSNIE